MHFEWIFIKKQGQIISDILKQEQKMRFYVSWYYIYINDQSYELNKIINKDVLWFFVKIVHQKSRKLMTMFVVPYSKIQPFTGKTITWTKEALHIY